MKRSENCNVRHRAALWLPLWFAAAMTAPAAASTVLSAAGPAAAVAQILIPAGFFAVWSAVLPLCGVMIAAAAPLLFLAALQSILLLLLGETIISCDMFSNLATTSVTESAELLGNIVPAAAAVTLLYGGVLAAGLWSAFRGQCLSRLARHRLIMSGSALLACGLLALLLPGGGEASLFPQNVICNHLLSRQQQNMIRGLDVRSAAGAARVRRTAGAPGREVYVMVIGESSRAFSWGAYGYARNTTPRIDTTRGVCLFSGILTQSNATCKSVPMMLSCAGAGTYNYLCSAGSIMELFAGAGFRTAFISNQWPDGAMIDRIACRADTAVYLCRDGQLHMDGELPEHLTRMMELYDGQNLLVVMHTYGSHFNYNNRYPEQHAEFRPDRIRRLNRGGAPQAVNAYDNSIRYTDYVLSRIIAALRSSGHCSAMLYCSDHGEDLFDDARRRFLHSSSQLTYYQLHVPCLVWMSPAYIRLHPGKAAAASANRNCTASTAVVYHTLADMACIEGPGVRLCRSLLSATFDSAACRLYLNSSQKAVSFSRTGINEDDLRIFRNKGVNL